MNPTIDRMLNLVVPVIRGDQTVLHVHSTPIRREAFEQYHLVLAKTYSQLMVNGLDARTAPSVAALVLTQVAKDTARAPGVNWHEGNDGTGGPAGLMAEIRRLSNALVPQAANGWSQVPLEQAYRQNLITEDERSDLEGLLVFFTVASRMAPRGDRERLIRGEAVIYNSLTTYLSCTDYAASLRISTPAGPTGGSPPP